MSDIAEIFASSAQRAPWGWMLLGSVILALIKGWPILQRLNNDRDGVRWTEMMSLNKSLSERIDALEKAAAESVRSFLHDMAEERKRCEEEIAELRKDHASEVAELRKELAGIYRMITSSNTAAARLFEPREDLPDDMKARLRQLEQGRKLDRGE